MCTRRWTILYLVAARQDLDTWARLLVRCGTKPAGIIVYDGDYIKIEDFVQSHRGDGEKLASQLRNVIQPTEATVTYDAVLGRPFDDSMRDSLSPWTVDDRYLGLSKRIVVGASGTGLDIV